MAEQARNTLSNAREWATVGATIYVTTHSPGRSHIPVTKGEVTRVTATTFVVTTSKGVEHRFQFSSLRAGAKMDGRVHLTHHQAHPEDDPMLPALIRAHNRYMATRRAHRRFDAWAESPSPQTREAAIEALQALRQFDPPAPE